MDDLELAKELRPTVYTLGVRCPVPYCQSPPHYKCVDPRGVYRAEAHRERQSAARAILALTPKEPTQ